MEMIGRLEEILRQYRTGLDESLRHYLEMVRNAEVRLEEQECEDVSCAGVMLDMNGDFVDSEQNLPELPLR
jgi:hypothetical protein